MDLLLEEAGIDHNPPGWPRPSTYGGPVPWVTVVSEHGPHFRLLDDRRLVACQRDMLCQLCGLPVDPTRSVVIVDRDGWCLTSAPLHRDHCAPLAFTACPAVASAAW